MLIKYFTWCCFVKNSKLEQKISKNKKKNFSIISFGKFISNLLPFELLKNF